jgi:hypothetical protein
LMANNKYNAKRSVAKRNV